MSKKSNSNGLIYVYDTPVKGEFYTGWVMRTGGENVQPITYLQQDGREVPEPISKLETEKTSKGAM